MTHKQRIGCILEILNKGLYEREEIISLALLSALAEQNVFLLGPPGTAKSLISRRLSKAFETKHYFEHLMQKFSTPEEVFGPISISELKKDNYIRKTDGFLPEAEFAFLDEIWKSSSAILNTLLTIINEKKFKNGAKVEKVPLKVLISASNEIPAQNQGLEALYDRFLIRLFVPPMVKRKNFETILQNGSSSDEISIPDDLKIKNKELQKWKKEIKKIRLSPESFNVIHSLRIEIEKRNKKNKKEDFIYISDRRWKKSAALMKASAFFCGRKETNIADCFLLSYCLWTSNENREGIKELVENIIKTNGFQINISLLDLDKEIDRIEKEKNAEFIYTSDVYDVKKLKNGKQYFQLDEKYANGSKQARFYIDSTQIQKVGISHAVDLRGNKLNWITYNYDSQGHLDISIYDNDKNTGKCTKIKFIPTVLFHKGDKKEEVDVQLGKILTADILKIFSKIENTLTEVKSKKEIFCSNLETPFLPKDKLAMTIISIDKQIDELELRLKDCERLKSLVK